VETDTERFAAEAESVPARIRKRSKLVFNIRVHYARKRPVVNGYSRQDGVVCCPPVRNRGGMVFLDPAVKKRFSNPSVSAAA
jgi:hypothetical protein